MLYGPKSPFDTKLPGSSNEEGLTKSFLTAFLKNEEFVLIVVRLSVTKAVG